MSGVPIARNDEDLRASLHEQESRGAMQFLWRRRECSKLVEIRVRYMEDSLAASAAGLALRDTRQEEI